MTHTYKPKGMYDPSPLPNLDPDLSHPTCFLSLHKVSLVKSRYCSVNIVITDMGFGNKNVRSGAQTSGHFLPVSFISILIVSSVCDSGPKILGVLWTASEQILAETPQLKEKHKREPGPSGC